MFWKKKAAVATPTGGGPAVTAPTGANPSVTQAEVPKSKAEKLPGPKDIPEVVGRHLVVSLKQNPDWVWKLRAVLRERNTKDTFDFRVFDGVQTAAKKAAIKDYTSLDQYPELILFQGWFDKKGMQVHAEPKAGEK